MIKNDNQRVLQPKQLQNLGKCRVVRADFTFLAFTLKYTLERERVLSDLTFRYWCANGWLSKWVSNIQTPHNNSFVHSAYPQVKKSHKQLTDNPMENLKLTTLLKRAKVYSTLLSFTIRSWLVARIILS